MASEVFVSHSVKDKAAADAVVARLEAEGLSCWIAPRNVLPGADWVTSIMKGIGAARIMILIFSRNANTSAHIKREVARAVEKNTYIIPLRLDDTPPSEELNYFISTYQWMDGFPPPLDQHLARLVQTVSAVLANSSPAPVDPAPAAVPQQPPPIPIAAPGPVGPPPVIPVMAPPPQVVLGAPTYLHQVPMPSAQGPSIGMRINVPVSVQHATGRTLQVVAKFSYANGPPLYANPQEMFYRDTNGLVATGTTPRIVANNEPSTEQSMTIPYYALNFPATNGFAAYNLALVVFAYLDNHPVAQSTSVFFGLRW